MNSNVGSLEVDTKKIYCKKRYRMKMKKVYVKNRSVIIRINTSATLFKCSKPPSFQNKSSKMFLSRSLKLSTERSAGLDTDSSVATIT